MTKNETFKYYLFLIFGIWYDKVLHLLTDHTIFKIKVEVAGVEIKPLNPIIIKMKITKKQYNKLLRINQELKNKNVQLIKKYNKVKLILGSSIIIVSLLTPFTNLVLIPLGCFILGLSFFDLKNVYYPEWKRKIKQRLRK